jgi:4'-phosphopantetheinyl transferase
VTNETEGLEQSLTLRQGQADIWLAWTEQCNSPALTSRYMAMLTAAELHRMSQYRLAHLRHEYLVTRALCRTVLSRYAPIAPEEWRFTTNDYGRPEISVPSAYRGLRFNLSNVRSLVACVVVTETDVGIDIEETSRPVDGLNLARHHFSPMEVEMLSTLNPAAVEKRFFDIWTLKEAYIKARGEGLSIALNSFSLGIDGRQIAITFDAPSDSRPSDWQFHLEGIGQSHVMALAIRKGVLDPFVIRVCETVPLGDKIG